MIWTDSALILSAKPLGEGKALVSVLSQEHGRHRGVVPGGMSSKRRHILQQGSRVRANWRARTTDQLGTVTCELQTGIGARIISDKLNLAAVAAACALIDAALPEREPSWCVYEATRELLEQLDLGAACVPAYLRWEVCLLALLGFGFNEATASTWTSTEANARTLGEGFSACLLRLEATVFAEEGRVPFARIRFADLCSGGVSFSRADRARYTLPG